MKTPWMFWSYRDVAAKRKEREEEHIAKLLAQFRVGNLSAIQKYEVRMGPFFWMLGGGFAGGAIALIPTFFFVNPPSAWHPTASPIFLLVGILFSIAIVILVEEKHPDYVAG